PAPDFDLYVQCGARPTPVSYLARSFTSTSQEFLNLVPANCCGQTIYIAVNSYQGAGYFNLEMTKHYQNQQAILSAGTGFSSTPTQKAAMKSLLTDSAKVFYGLTLGTQYIQQYSWYDSNDCWGCQGPCDICFTMENQS